MGGKRNNGHESWRRLSAENEGGAEHVALAGLRKLHSFPNCPSTRHMRAHLGEWQHLMQRQGSNTRMEAFMLCC